MRRILNNSILAIFLISIVSCSTDEEIIEEVNSVSQTDVNYKKENIPELDISNFVLDKKTMDNVVNEISLIRADIENQSDKEIKRILTPILENGEILHNEMLTFLERNGELDKLTSSEVTEISNLTDEQLIELSFITYNQYQYSTSSVDWGQVRSCASFALGIQGIKTLYTNTLALGTVETMIGALKLIGKRYLGYIGVALMIYDFADCLYG
jgi:hypothetical protein